MSAGGSFDTAQYGKSRAIRGILANIKAGLALKFQFNPPAVETTKGVNYNIQTIPGWSYPDIVFEHGGVKRIKFDLWFDRTNGAVGTGFQAIGIPLVGTDAIKAVIESFLYPKREILSFIGAPPTYTSPPRGVLILGTNFYDVIVEGDGGLKNALHDKLLTPVRLFASMSFIVIEEGAINNIQTARRQALAVAQSAMNATEIVAEVFTTLGPNLLA